MKKVFLVEDDMLLSFVEEKLVTKLGYQVVGKATTGQQAIDSISELNPDIVLMDHHLRGDLDGFDVLIEMRKLKLNTPVIFISGDNYEEDVQRAMDMGCVDFLLKPVNEGILEGPLNKASKMVEDIATFAA